MLGYLERISKCHYWCVEYSGEWHTYWATFSLWGKGLEVAMWWARNDVLQKEIMESGSMWQTSLPIIKSSSGAEVAYTWWATPGGSRAHLQESGSCDEHFSMGSCENLSKVAHVLSHFRWVRLILRRESGSSWIRHFSIGSSENLSGMLRTEPLLLLLWRKGIGESGLRGDQKWCFGEGELWKVAHCVSHFLYLNLVLAKKQPTGYLRCYAAVHAPTWTVHSVRNLAGSSSWRGTSCLGTDYKGIDPSDLCR